MVSDGQAYNGHSECLKVLLSYNASVDARSHGGVTALIAAAEGRNGDCTQILLQAGAQVNARTSEGKTALVHAVSHNCVGATEVLLTGGAEINAADGDGCTALHHGARNNSVDCLGILLERGADVTRKCRRGRMPIQEAPKGSQAAKLLEESWKKLESEIAMRQMEVLNLFAEDRNDHKSNTSKRTSTRHAREKKSGRRKDPLEKTDRANQDLPNRGAIIKADDESTFVDELSSSLGSGVVVNQAPSRLMLGVEEDSGPGKSVHLYSGVIPDKIGKEASLVCSPIISSVSYNSEASTPFSAAENVFENRDEWIKVDGKRTAAVGSPPKTNVSQSETRGVTSTVSLMGPADHLLTERKISGGQSKKYIQGASKILKENDCRNAESLPWVQALSRRTHSIEDRSARPCLDASSRSDSLLERKAEDNMWEIAGENQSGTEEVLSNRVQRIELELEQARQGIRADMQKVKELERLLSAPQLGTSETNSVQVLDLTRSLEIQIRARVQAENANMDTELRIRDLEAVVSSQRKALESVQTEVAELKLQMLRREEQRKQECELQWRESIAAAMAAAAGSCRAWELHHSRESLRGWISESAETLRSEFALLLLRSGSGYKMDGYPLTPAFFKWQKKSGNERSRENSIEWKSTATAAAMAAASMIGIKSCSGCSALESHSSSLPHNVSRISLVSETLLQSGVPECTCNQHECDVTEAHEAPTDQESSKVGKGMVRSASEGSLQFADSGADQRAQDLLPFIPMAGLKTDPVTGWFSLVPSPVE